MDRNRSSRFALLHSWSALPFVGAVLGVVLLFAGCVHPAEPQPPQPTTVSGRVVQAADEDRGVPGVMVRTVGKSYVTTTDSTGTFSFEVSVADWELLQLSLSKTGFIELVTSLSARSGQRNNLGTLRLASSVPGGPGGSGSGAASNVVLKSVSTSSIGVRHSGSNESAQLVFEVRDALGRPVDLDHRVTIQFTLIQRAGGGATLAPDTVSTSASGLATATVQSGALAQAVQVRAQVMGGSIFSDPASVAIHGGLPDAQHFSFAVGKVNVPGLVSFGVLDPVTAYVGDQYGNPVPEGTVVYFTTTGGLIQGSATTDEHGRATVDLLTAEPLPNNLPALSDSAGVARISVQTLDQNQVAITRSLPAVMFSGHTSVGVTPSTFDIPLNGSQDFVVTVWDREHHNPLSEGTTITFTATLGTLGGETAIVLPDTRDAQYTTFAFRLENSSAGPALVGPNRAKIMLRPIAPSQATAGNPTYATAGFPGRQQPMGAQVLTPASVTVKVSSRNGNVTSIVSGRMDRP